MEELRRASDLLQSILAGKGDLKAQYTVAINETREITMELGNFTLFRTLFDKSATVSVIKDRKSGSADVNRFDEATLQSVVDSAVAAAETGTEDEYYDIAPGMAPESFSWGVLEPDIDRLMIRTKEFYDTVTKEFPKVLLSQIIVKHTRIHSLYRNTNGSEDVKETGYYEIVAEFAGNDGTNTTGIAWTGVDMISLDRPFIELGNIKKDLADAEAALNKVEFSGKFEGDVIFTPGSVTQIIYYALSNFASDRVILDKTALWLDKIGKEVAAKKLTVGLRPWDERIVNHEVHTRDGFRSVDYDIIKDGVLTNFMTGLYASRKCKVDRAPNSGFDLVIEPGDVTFDEMVRSVKRGIIVGSISCGAPSGNGELSGVAKNSFYVEDGKIKGALIETMINGNLADMLHNVRAISSEVICDGGSVLPYILADHIVISGK